MLYTILGFLGSTSVIIHSGEKKKKKHYSVDSDSHIPLQPPAFQFVLQRKALPFLNTRQGFFPHRSREGEESHSCHHSGRYARVFREVKAFCRCWRRRDEARGGGVETRVPPTASPSQRSPQPLQQKQHSHS